MTRAGRAAATGAYVLAAGRHASAYARGYSADLASRTFDASRKDTTP